MNGAIRTGRLWNRAVQYGPCEYTMRFSLHLFEIHITVAFLCVPLSFMASALQFFRENFLLVFHRSFALCFDLVGTDCVKRRLIVYTLHRISGRSNSAG